ncbi:DedA family protein [Fictibacillus sp. NRS-1165]|uniref:DedA family protein n=1 Tax=Fictibacillus sp. NRS-1165 TaxID=3144463 RepID=UPI003D1DCCBA
MIRNRKEQVWNPRPDERVAGTMDYGFLIHFFQEHGYLGVFVLSWIGFFGLPVPNEIIVMSTGMLAASALLNPVLSFFMTYLGVISVLSLSYALGRYGGAAVLRVCSRNGRMNKGIQKGSSLLGRWGDKILVFSFFVPGLRLLMPFVVGSYRLSFYRFAALTYPAGFLWVIVYFAIGTHYGKHILQVNRYFQEHQWLVPLVCGAVFVLWVVRYAIVSRREIRASQKSMK